MAEVTWTCAADPGELAGLRATAGRWLGAHGVQSDECMELVLVISELVSNAIQATADGGTPVELRLRLVDGTVAMTVADRGPGFDHADVAELETMAEVGATRGRGLPIVAAMTDELTTSRRAGVTEVRVTRRLNPDRTPPRGG